MVARINVEEKTDKMHVATNIFGKPRSEPFNFGLKDNEITLGQQQDGGQEDQKTFYDCCLDGL